MPHQREGHLAEAPPEGSDDSTPDEGLATYFDLDLAAGLLFLFGLVVHLSGLLVTFGGIYRSRPLGFVDVTAQVIAAILAGLALALLARKEMARRLTGPILLVVAIALTAIVLYLSNRSGKKLFEYLVFIWGGGAWVTASTLTSKARAACQDPAPLDSSLVAKIARWFLLYLVWAGLTVGFVWLQGRLAHLRPGWLTALPARVQVALEVGGGALCAGLIVTAAYLVRRRGTVEEQDAEPESP